MLSVLLFTFASSCCSLGHTVGVGAVEELLCHSLRQENFFLFFPFYPIHRSSITHLPWVQSLNWPACIALWPRCICLPVCLAQEVCVLVSGYNVTDLVVMPHKLRHLFLRLFLMPDYPNHLLFLILFLCSRVPFPQNTLSIQANSSFQRSQWFWSC